MIHQNVKQLVWAFGVLERLANLGFLENPAMFVGQENIDLFLEIDSYCDILFDNDEQFNSLFKRICKDMGITESKDVFTVTELARSYRDDRTNLIRFALNNSQK